MDVLFPEDRCKDNHPQYAETWCQVVRFDFTVSWHCSDTSCLFFSLCKPIILQKNIDNSERSPSQTIDLQSAIVAVKRWQKDMTASHRNHSLQCTYSRAVFIPMRTQPPHHSHILKMSPSPHPSNLSHTTSEASLPTAVEQ